MQVTQPMVSESKNGKRNVIGTVQDLVQSNTLISAATILALLVIWILATSGGRIASLFWPSPMDVIESLMEVQSSILEHIFATLGRVIAGLLLGSFLGVLCGLVMSWSEKIFATLDPIIELIRPVPPISFIPFFILWMGISDVGKVLLVTIGCFMITVIITIEAVKGVAPIFIRAAQSLGANQLDIFQTVIVPAITPSLVAAFRVSLAVAFSLTIASEFMGAQAGLGYLLMFARRILRTDTLLLGTIIIGFLAWVADLGIRSAASYLLRWTESPRKDRPFSSGKVAQT